MSSNESNSDIDKLCENAIFVQLLSENKILFNKERTPQIQKKKERALEKIRVDFSLKTKQNLNIKQIKKKFNNLKIRVREAADKINVGYSKRVLKDWETEFLELNDEDEKNHTIFSVAPGEKEPPDTKELLIENPLDTLSNLKCTSNILLKNDDSMTYKHFGTEELKRLLLIAQIKAAQAQEKAAAAQERAAIAEEALACVKKNHLLQNAFWS